MSDTRKRWSGLNPFKRVEIERGPSMGVPNTPIMLRAPTPGRKWSLFEDVSPGNVGNVFEIAPSATQDNTLASFGQLVRVLEVRGDDSLGEMICVSIQQETTVFVADSSAPRYDSEGPLVGRVEFGAGSGLSTFEFDIPAPRTFPGIPNVFQIAGSGTLNLAVAPRNNGVLLTLPASSLRVFVRNDANAPYIINASGGPSVPLNGFNKAPGKIRVHATYGRRTTQAKLTRTYPVCHNSDGGTTNTFDQQSQIDMAIPTYARVVTFPRFPLDTSSLIVNFFASNIIGPGSADLFFAGPYAVPTASIGSIEIPTWASLMRVTNPGEGSAQIQELSFDFDLGI